MSLPDEADRNESSLEDEILIEGMMAAGALIALADQNLEIEETLTLESLLNGPELLKRHDLESALKLYLFYIERLREDFPSGKQEALEAITLCSQDIEGPALIVRGGIAVAQSDHELSDCEVTMIEEICQAMGIEGLDTLGLTGRPTHRSN
ncbi:MAG: hypothetical protein CL917_15985 [Deltaproteobacteria bacterium]|nr:hypothetical protein [Deltaproteobacteria bacterium]